MRLKTIATAAIASLLLLPTGVTLAQEPEPVESPGAAAAAASGAPDAGTSAVADAVLELIPVEAGGLALREQAMTFSGEEMRDNSDADELALLDAAIASAGDPAVELMGVAAVLATTSNGQGGLMLQGLKVPGMPVADGLTFWTSMLDLANETSTTTEVAIGGKSAISYTSPDDPDVTAHVYAVDGAAWLIIASDPDILEALFAQLP